MRDSVIADEARRVFEANPHGNKQEWGSALHDRLSAAGNPVFDHWLFNAQLVACTRQVERVAASERRDAFAVSHDGQALGSSAIVSVREMDDEGETVLMQKLWRYCTPSEFVEAVRREQNVIDGRRVSNEKRREVVGILMLRPELMEEPTIEAAVIKAGLNPDGFFLDQEIA